MKRSIARLMILAGGIMIGACGRDASPPRNPQPVSATMPASSADAPFADALRQFDRDVMDRLRRMPDSERIQIEAPALARGTTLDAPASAAAIEALERRIGKPLPPSYRAFVETSNGMLFVGALNIVTMHPVDNVVKLSPQNYPGIAGWIANPDVAVPLDPTAGGPLPGAWLRSAWVISSVEDGDVYLIFPDLAGPDGEWPVWYFSNAGPGARAYRSFRVMFERERGPALRVLDRRLLHPSPPPPR